MKITNYIKLLLNFSRLHTIVGTFIGSIAMFLIVIQGFQNISKENLVIFARFAFFALCMNIYVVGINQIYDIEVDKINKPYLPLPSNQISRTNGWIIVSIAFFLAWILSLSNSILVITAAIISLIGYLYSVPPFRLRNNFTFASLLILIGRGVLLNLSAYLYFDDELTSSLNISNKIAFIIFFMSIFSLAISLFKDLPDVEGDTKYSIRTSPVVLGSSKVFSIVILLLLVNFISALYFLQFIFTIRFDLAILIYHISVIVSLVISKIKETTLMSSILQLKRFYWGIWILLYIEYVVFLISF